jgi:excinuclease ABC subunit C
MFTYDAKAFPETPGIYRMSASDGKTIYIGKAKDLRKRLSQYFVGRHDGRHQLDLLLRDVTQVETITTTSEKDALILENQLIKREKPKYNIRLKDDKTFPYIRLSKDEFPRIEVSRQRNDKEYEVYGPYTISSTAQRLVELISSQYGLRRCPGVPIKMLDRACLYAQIGQCSAPCVNKKSAAEYAEDVAEARELLKGKTGALIRSTKQKMLAASELCDYERAAYLRDQWKALVNFERGGVMEGGKHRDVDVIATVQQRGWVIISLLQVRNAELWHSEVLQHRSMGPWEEEASSLLMEIYSHRDVPKKVVIDFEMDDHDVLEQLLSERSEHTIGNISITRPQRGELKSWISMARQNARAEASCRDATGQFNLGDEELMGIQKECDLPKLPKLTIALDCANFSLEEPVGGVVVFRDGRADKKSYRKFKVRGDIQEHGDVHHVEEVLERYLKRFGDPLPDVILIDGGIEQVKAAARAMKRCGMSPDASLMGISKGPDRKSGDELLHFYGREAVMTLAQTPLSMPFWTAMRDEAHRISNRFTGERLTRERLSNPFTKIPGIGPKTSAILRQSFGSLKKLLNAELSDLEDLKKLNKRQVAMLNAYIQAQRP